MAPINQHGLVYSVEHPSLQSFPPNHVPEGGSGTPIDAVLSMFVSIHVYYIYIYGVLVFGGIKRRVAGHDSALSFVSSRWPLNPHVNCVLCKYRGICPGVEGYRHRDL